MGPEAEDDPWCVLAIGVDRRSGEWVRKGAGIRWDGPKRDGSRWGVDERTCKIRAAHMDDADYLGVANGT